MAPLFHFTPFLLLIVPIIYGLTGYLKNKNSSNTISKFQSKASFTAIINSAVLYALSFNIIFFIQELFLALGKKWLGLKAYLYHNNHNWDGTHPMQGLAQGLGALAILIFGVIVFGFIRAAKKTSWIYVFLVWLSFEGFAQSIPQFITAFIAKDTDTGQAFTYLKIGEPSGILISIACIFFMLYVCSIYSKLFLNMSSSHSVDSNAFSKFKYLFGAVILASFLGAIICIPFRIMPWNRAVMPFMVTLISVPMIWAYGWRIKSNKGHDNMINHKIAILPIFFLLLVLFFFQLVLAKGLIIQ